jgi:hypothetical protein
MPETSQQDQVLDTPLESSGLHDELESYLSKMKETKPDEDPLAQELT